MQKLLYVGTLASDSTSYSRFCALEKFYDVVPVQLPDINKGLNRIKQKLNLNKKEVKNLVIEQVKANKFDIIWFDKPIFVTTTFIKEVKRYAVSSILVAHLTDDLNVASHHFNSFIEAAKQFSFIFTCNIENIKEFSDLPIFYNELGFDSCYFKVLKKNVKYNDDIVFVGHYELAYFEQLKEIAKQAAPHGFNVKVFGSGWWRAKFKFNTCKNLIVKSGWISRDEMTRCYQHSKLAVALYSSVNRNKTSARIFELAALGVPFLVKPNKIIEENIIQYFSFDQIYSDKFWEEIKSNYSNIRHEFIVQSSKYERHSWSYRISECIEHFDK